MKNIFGALLFFGLAFGQLQVGDTSPDFMRTLKRGDTFKIRGKDYKVRSKTKVLRKVDDVTKFVFEPVDGKGENYTYLLNNRENKGRFL